MIAEGWAEAFPVSCCLPFFCIVPKRVLQFDEYPQCDQENIADFVAGCVANQSTAFGPTDNRLSG
jgi:hypothetical protein